MTTYSDISTRAMLATFTVSTWTARKFDKRVTEDVADRNQATVRAGRYNKDMLAGATLHKAVLHAADHARQLHYEQTLPWTDAGARLLPTLNYQTYTDTMRHARDAFEQSVDAFIANYASICADAKRELGALYVSADYPSVDDLREKFAWAIEFAPVPCAGDLRVALPADEIVAIEARLEARNAAATRDAMIAAWTRLRDAVARIAKATQPDGVVRGNLLDYVREMADSLGRLNVAHDHDLDAMCARVQYEIASLSVDDLRTDDAVRAATQAKATAMLDAMAAFFPKSAPIARTDVA